MEQEQNAKHCGNPTPEGRLSFLFRRTDRQLRRCIEKKVNQEMQSLRQFLERIYENLLRDQQKEE